MSGLDAYCLDHPACLDCRSGDHCWCDGETLDNVLDEYVPCPCAEAGHE